MNEGNLVKVYNRDGTVFGRGILLSKDSKLNDFTPNEYCEVWMFNYVDVDAPEKKFTIETRLVTHIESDNDW